ncbi:MAG: hypothetical protein R6X19_10090 [Kiritimatiellia bacterium]
MKIDKLKALGVLAVAAVVSMVGCKQKTEPEPVRTVGFAEKAGAEIDAGVKKTEEAARDAAEDAAESANEAAAATREAAANVRERTGEAVEKAGAAVEKTGEDMQP